MVLKRSYLPLYIKWRPKNFFDLKNQNHILKILKHSIRYNKLHHSYIFHGPSGVGKTSLARILVKYLNCKFKNKFKSCDNCNNCKLIDSKNFSDFLEIDGASKRSVNDISVLLDNVSFFPIMGLYKIYLIDEFHMLSSQALSIMLKLLEEPPSYVKFILITTDLDKIPFTIISRCICFNFKKISNINLVLFISRILVKEKIFFTRKSLLLLSDYSKGNIRDSLSLLEKLMHYKSKSIKSKFIYKILNNVSFSFLLKIIFCIKNSNIENLLKICKFLNKNDFSYFKIIFDLIGIFLNLIELQYSREFNSFKFNKKIYFFSIVFSPKKIYYLYKIAFSGIKDLNNLNNYTTFIMILLKMLFYL